MAEARPKRERKATKKFEPDEEAIPVPKAKPARKRMKKEPFNFGGLPPNVRLRVASFLTVGTLCSSATVSKDFKELSENNSIWGKHTLERFRHFFELDGGTKSEEAILSEWPAKNPFKEVYRTLIALENQKQSEWAQWGSQKSKSTASLAGSEINGKCPLCEGSLFIEKNEAPKKEEEDEDPPSEFIVQCKNTKCGFVLPYSSCATCKKPCNMMNTLICGGDKCDKLPVDERIQCSDCAKECAAPEKQDCLGHMCPKCIITVKTKKATAYSCPLCAFNCKACGTWYFAETDKWICRKCKVSQCNQCSHKGCTKCGYKSDKEDEDEEFGGESEEDEDDYDAASD